MYAASRESVRSPVTSSVFRRKNCASAQFPPFSFHFPPLQILTGLILGSTFWRSGFTATGVSNRASFFIFSITSLVFPSFFALPIFIEERKIYIRETSRGAYRTASYVVADALVWLPFLFALGLVFSAVAYFMVGLAPTAAAFFG